MIFLRDNADIEFSCDTVTFRLSCKLLQIMLCHTSVSLGLLLLFQSYRDYNQILCSSLFGYYPVLTQQTRFSL